MHSDTLRITVPKEQLLAKLRDNMANHLKVVQEAKAGYIKAAEKAILAKLDELRSGSIVALQFSLHMPESHIKEYKTAIRMLEWTTDTEVALTTEEFRSLVEDQWDWYSRFLSSNAAYSGLAAGASAAAGFDGE